MRDLNDLYFFVQVVQHNGFAAAGRALDIPKSTLSRRIQELESRLGVRLIHRSSRRFVVTDVGREFLRHAKAMLIEAEAAVSSVQSLLAEPSGIVRFTCPVGMASVLAGLLPRFLAAHPKVCLVQHATNRYVDILEEGFDLALRGHAEPLADSNLIKRRLIHAPWALVASAAYLEQAGLPTTPKDLERHAALMLGNGGIEDTWILRRGTEEQQVSVTARLRSDDMETLRTAAAAGVGIAAMPDYLCRPDIESGALLRVLPEWIPGEGTVTMLVPSRRGQLPSVRAFMDFLIDEFPTAAASRSA